MSALRKSLVACAVMLAFTSPASAQHRLSLADGGAQPRVRQPIPAPAPAEGPLTRPARLSIENAALSAGLEQLFRVCRAAALESGRVEGFSEGQIDASIGEICDADIAWLKVASDEEFQRFADESRAIVNQFLESLP